MDLKLRAVPQEVYGVMELNENFNFQWNPDPVSSLIGLGTSYVLEFFEFYGERIGDYYDEFIPESPQKDARARPSRFVLRHRHPECTSGGRLGRSGPVAQRAQHKAGGLVCRARPPGVAWPR